MLKIDNKLLSFRRGMLRYCKVPKFWDARKLCCYLPKIQTKKPHLRVFCQKDANGIANRVDPDQTVCPDLSVRELMTITVHKYCKIIKLRMHKRLAAMF